MPTPRDLCHDEEYTLPCAEALLGGTMALMTGLRQAQCAQHRELIAHKIASNLAALADSPQLSAGFRQLIASLRQRWLAEPASVAQATVLWHLAPAALQ